VAQGEAVRDFRKLTEHRTDVGEDGAAYQMPSPKSGDLMQVIVSNGGGWDHVSVSLKHRCPNWIEMEYVKRMFFYERETAMQLHVAHNEHINCHPNCLHIWRPQNEPIPLPPGWMVA